MSSARVLINGHAEWAAMKMRGERPGPGRRTPQPLPTEIEISFFFFDTLKIGILIYKRSHVPFSWMIKAVMCPSQLHFMTPTFPSSTQRRLISAQPK